MFYFCGSPDNQLWNSSITWNTSRPKLSDCFKDTLPLLVPCCIFYALLPLEIYQLKNLATRAYFKWQTLDFIRIAFSIVLCFACLVRIIGKSVFSYLTDFDWILSGAVSYFILFLTLVIITFLTFLRQQYGYTGSAAVWLTIVSLIITGSFEFLTSSALIYNDIENVWRPYDIFEVCSYFAYYFLLIFNIISLSFSSYIKDYELLTATDEQPPWPEDYCSFPNRLLYWWVVRIVRLGYNKALEVKDVFFVHSVDRSANICEYFCKELEKEFSPVVASKRPTYDSFSDHQEQQQQLIPKVSIVRKAKSASFAKVLIKCFGGTFVWCGFLQCCAEMLRFSEAVFVGLITSYAQNPNEYMWHGFTYVAVFALILVVQVILAEQAFFAMIRGGNRMRSGLMSAIYRKALKLSNEARKSLTIGEVVNLMSVDAARFRDFALTLQDVIPAPFIFTLSFLYLYFLVGHAVWGAVAVTSTIFIMNASLLGIYEKWETAEMELKDNRLKILSEVITGIKAIKLYAWEVAFENRINSIRSKELQFRRKASYLSGAFEVGWNCTILFASLATFASFVWFYPDQPLTPQIVFVSLTLLGQMNFTIQFLPEAVVQMITLKVSIGRMYLFFAGQELDQKRDAEGSRCFDAPETDAVHLNEANFAWEISSLSFQTDLILRKITLHIETGKLIAVVGPVGCGKSSLLSALCGEMPCVGGHFCIKGSIAYVPQISWIQNLTLRDNILFGRDFDTKLYNEVLDACALRTDLEILPGGDMTEIGERGINLSGGQKMRISLARAIYQNRDVYLLDDPLAAVDIHVGKHIFQQVLGAGGMLASKTRVLVTHNLSFLPECDLIVVLKDGSVEECASYNELLDKQGAFSELIDFYGQESARDADEENLERERLESRSQEQQKAEARKKRASSADSTVNRLSSGSAQERREFHKSASAGKLYECDESEEDEEEWRLTEAEGIRAGNVSWSVYFNYAKAAGLGLVFYAICVALSSGCQLAGTLWLQVWSDNAHQLATNLTSRNITTAEGLKTYGLIGLGQTIFVSSLGPFFASFQVKAATQMHGKLMHGLFRAPMSFFDTTPIGRITNRCGRDTDVIDKMIPEYIVQFCHFIFESSLDILAVILSIPYFVVAVVPCAICYFFAQRFYIRTSRQLRRLEAVSRSPIFSHFQESINGVSVIRAFRQQSNFILQSEQLIDKNCSMDMVRALTNRWVATFLNLFASSLVCLVAVLIIIMVEHGMTAGMAGFTLSYAVTFIGKLMWGVWTTGALETEMVAVERISEYANTESEADWENNVNKPALSWPERGEVEFQNYSTRYRPGLPFCLNQLSVNVASETKVGVVGRTGAGKSSMTLALFRLIEAIEGRICIDQVDISQLGLHNLRRKLTIIPQDPVLFSGTLRENIDPFGNYPDSDVWMTLELSHLKAFVSGLPEQLLYEISEGGSNLSVGQRQLLCLARALLRKSKILILDEATASVDVETDALIQQTIREQFGDCTIITIAHRLNTIMDSDKILVLDNGRLVEFDGPDVLLENKESLFYKMYQELSIVL